jgi:cytochrome c-type biogenesis protein CcmH
MRKPRASAMKALRALLIVAFALVAASAAAVEPNEVMKDPTLEARARALSAELRCMVCQNQSIDDSDAPLAHDIRVLIRERIGQGESNAAVRAFLVSRYGNFILLKPPLEPATLLLWASGPLTLALGALGIWFAGRRRAPPAPALSAEEEARLAEIAGEDAAL